MARGEVVPASSCRSLPRSVHPEFQLVLPDFVELGEEIQKTAKLFVTPDELLIHISDHAFLRPWNSSPFLGFLTPCDRLLGLAQALGQVPLRQPHLMSQITKLSA